MTREFLKLLQVKLNVFDANTQVTTNNTAGTNDMSPQMKTFYDKNIIRNAVPLLVHDQFGQKRPIPKNGGKTIEFRKLSPLPKALTPLTEGVTPSGRNMNWSSITATVQQYGDYITLSDMLLLTAIDNNLVEAGIILGNQAGETLDTVTREVINAGTNVQYADGVAARYLLVGGDATYANNDYLTVRCIKRAVRTLKRNKAKKISSDYVAIVHPDIAFDLTDDPKWENVKTYQDANGIYAGEIGRLHGVRFTETTEAKVFQAAKLTAAARNLTVASVNAKVFTVDEAISAGEATALIGRKIIIKEYLYTVSAAAAGAAGAATITVSETVSGAPGDNDIIYPGEAAAAGRDVYSTLVIGQDAYGVTEIEGGGLQNIIKQLGSGGTADPLNQRATTGWKAVKTAEILVQEYMVRIETASSYA